MSFLVGGLLEGRHAISWVGSIELGGVSVIVAWRTDVACYWSDPAGLALGCIDGHSGNEQDGVFLFSVFLGG